MNSSRARWVFALIIVVVGLAVYSNTFHVPFQWDGNSYIMENQIIRDLDYFGDISKAVGHPRYPEIKSRYVSYLSFALNYNMHGFSYPGWHAVNIAIHITNALLVFGIVLSLFKTPILKDSGLSRSSQLIALLCGLYFVAHPMQTMAVTYIYQRLASLAALFYLASTLAYLRARLAEGTNKRYLLYGASLVFAVVAMKTKENAITLPIAIMVMELMFFTGPLRRRLLPLIPVFMIAAIVPLSILSQFDAPVELTDRVERTLKFLDRASARQLYLFTQFVAITKYLRLYALPVEQSLIHDIPDIKSFFEPGVVLSFTFLCSLAGLAVWLFIKGRRQRPELLLISFGIAWHFITHFIESSIIQLPLKVQEYRAYIPSVGIFLSSVTFAMLLAGNLSSQALRKAALGAMVLIAILFSVLTYERNKVWATPMSLWEDTLEKSPTDPRGYNNVGLLYSRQEMLGKALPLYKKAIAIDSSFGQAYNNLGKLYMSIGELEQAERTLNIAIQVDSELAEAFSNLGSIYSSRGEFETALEHLNKSLEINRDFAIAWYNRGLLYQRMNDYGKSVSDYRTALALNPKLNEAHTNLGAIYVNRGDHDTAIRHLSEALRLNPQNAKSHYNLAYALFKAGEIDEAKAEVARSLAIDPNYPRAVKLLRSLSELEQ